MQKYVSMDIGETVKKQLPKENENNMRKALAAGKSLPKGGNL